MKLESVVVFCGSKNGQNPNYVKQTTELGKLIALLNLRMVYGGGKAGLMGVIADSVLANGMFRARGIRDSRKTQR